MGRAGGAWGTAEVAAIARTRRADAASSFCAVVVAGSGGAGEATPISGRAFRSASTDRSRSIGTTVHGSPGTTGVSATGRTGGFERAASASR